MMCLEINESPVKEDSQRVSAHHTEQLNSEVGFEENHSEVHLEAQPEQSLLLQVWIKSKIQPCITEDQPHTNEV